MTYSEAIINRINFLCAERELNLNKLASLSGLGHSTLENVMKGHTKSPGLRTLYLIARGFGMTVSEFLDFEEMNKAIFEDE